MGGRGSSSQAGKPGGLAANVTLTNGMRAQEAQRVQQANAYLGTNFTTRDFVALSGAPDGAEFEMKKSDTGIELVVRNYETGLNMRRTIFRDGDVLSITNDEFIAGSQAGGGFGTRAFLREVQAARRAGFDAIYTEGYRSDQLGFNGYYTWARLGYNARIGPDIQKIARDKGLGNPRDLHELMKTPGGRQIWKEHGRTTHMTFELNSGPSVSILTAYARSKGIKVAR